MVTLVRKTETKRVGIKVVVCDETGQRERDMNIEWLKRLSLENILDDIETAVEEIE